MILKIYKAFVNSKNVISRERNTEIDQKNGRLIILRTGRLIILKILFQTFPSNAGFPLVFFCVYL